MDIPTVSPTPNEMRQYLVREQRSNALVRRVMDTAHHCGLSGEDLYVMLAYHAVQALDNTTAQLMDCIAAQPPRAVFVEKKP